MSTVRSESLSPLAGLQAAQEERTNALLKSTPTLGAAIESNVLPFVLDPSQGSLNAESETTLAALEKVAASIAIKSLVSLAKAGDIDHLGGGLELIPALLMTLASTDYDKRQFAIEHGHTSIGYYASLAALGFLPEDRVIDSFRHGYLPGWGPQQGRLPTDPVPADCFQIRGLDPDTDHLAAAVDPRRSDAHQPSDDATRLPGLPKHRLGRPGTVEEVAHAALFLAAPESSYINGHILTVDGGWTAH